MRSLHLWLALLASLVYSLSFAASTPAPVTTFRNYSTLQQLGAGPENTLLYKGRQIVAGGGGGSATVQNLTFQAGPNATITGNDDAKTVTFGVYSSPTFHDVITKGPRADIRAYGAVPGTDCTTAIANAVNAVTGTGGTVYIPVGTFKVRMSTTALAQLNNISIVGEGRGSVIQMDWTGTNSAATYKLFRFNGDNVRLENFTVDGNKAAIPFTLVGNSTFKCVAFYGELPRVKYYNHALRHMVFNNLPGGTTPAGTVISSVALESFPLSYAAIGNLVLDDIECNDCDTTLAPGGMIDLGIDNEANWATDIRVSNIRINHSATVPGNWMGFGTYGVKRLVADNIIVNNCRQNALNIEFCEDCVINGAVLNNGGRQGIEIFGYAKNVVINRPIIRNPGRFFGSGEGGAVIASSGGNWWRGVGDTDIIAHPENKIVLNPVSYEIIEPTLVDIPNDVQYFYTNTATAANSGDQLETVQRDARIIWRVSDATKIASWNSVLRNPGIDHQLADINYHRVALDQAYKTSDMTVTKVFDNGGLGFYYQLTGTSSYSNVQIPLNVTGLYAYRAKVKWVSGNWTAPSVSDESGGMVPPGVLRHEVDIPAVATSDWITVAGVVGTMEDSEIKFSKSSANGGSETLLVRDFELAQVAPYQSDGLTLLDVTQGRPVYGGTAAPTSSSYRYVAGTKVMRIPAVAGQPDYWIRATTGTSQVLGTDWIPAGGSNGGSVNKAVCWKAVGVLGYCSAVVASDGSCGTCN